MVFVANESMARGKTLSVVFKANHQHQIMAFPPSLDELVAADHPVRVVQEVLERVDITAIMQQYKPGGASSYHPRMLLKALVYAYINNIYSSRKIEQALQESIYFMWLTGMSKPDHNTINRFRGQRLQKTLQPIFTQVVLLLCEEGLLSLKDLYTDGTKIEANANRYTFVWGKAIKTSKERIKQQLDDLWKYAQSVAASELDDTDPSSFKRIEQEAVTATVETINNALKDKKIDGRIRQKLNYARKHWPAALARYEQQEKLLGNRNSFSKTDRDATFMRMKEDHMRNGQLKPGYNVQISTNNQFIASYSLHPNPTDTKTLIPHLQQHIKAFKQKPANITADAGYGSEQNYQWLENKRITAYVKHNEFDRDQRHKKRDKAKPYATDKFIYNPVTNRYKCPAGKGMRKMGERIKTNHSGYEQTLTRYQSKSCNGCPLRGLCNPDYAYRTIEVNLNWNRLKQAAQKRLKTKRGIEKRKKRCFDTEPVFAQIKHNHQFKRFLMRGLEKVTVEMGLLALAHNLRKKAA
jgi:transposase